MVGINSAIARRSEDGLAITGINFAIKSSVVRGWLGKMLPQVETKKTRHPEPAPPPVAVAAAEPPPLEPEREEPPPSDELADHIPSRAKRGSAKQSLPAAPPEGKRGFDSSEPPGKTLSPQEAVRWHAKRSEEHTSELQSPDHLVCRLLLEKKKCETTTPLGNRLDRLLRARSGGSPLASDSARRTLGVPVHPGTSVARCQA